VAKHAHGAALQSDLVSLRTRLRSIWTPILIGLVLVCAIGVVAYVQVAVKQIEEELPLRVMEEKRDMERVARNFYEFLTATEAAQAHPTEGNVSNIRDHMNAIERDLETLRTRYTFDTLIGASALHAAISPTVDDARIWLTDGFGALKPTSPILLDLVVTRVRDTMSKIYDKTTEADRIAYDILEQQSIELTLLRNRLILVLTAVVALTGGVIWLAARQQRAAAQRAAAEEAERRAQTRLQEALESTSEGFAFFDANERLVIGNSRYRDIFLKGVRELIDPGVSFSTILDAIIERDLVVGAADDPKRWVAWRLGHFRDPRGPFSLEYTDGSWIQIDERKTGDGGTVVVYSDITESKQREFELVHSKEEAEAASEAKSSFLANVSHELRTPLTSILGFARIIQKRFETVVVPEIDPGDKRVDRALEQIQGNLGIMLLEGDRLTKLVNDVLDLEKIEAGEMVWNIEALDVTTLINQAAAATESLYRQKRLEFKTTIAPELPGILGDHDRVVQVLVNLVSNAVKFTDTGQICCQAEWGERGRVYVSVADSGNGIAADDQLSIFEKFRQVGDTLTEKPSGTGLGLPICREIVEHLGGEITVESTVGMGSKFIFWLPAVESDSEVHNKKAGFQRCRSES